MAHRRLQPLAAGSLASSSSTSSYAQGMAGTALTKRIDRDSRFISIARLALTILILPVSWYTHGAMAWRGHCQKITELSGKEQMGY